MPDNISDLASIGPRDNGKRDPAGVCGCGRYIPPELREAHRAEHLRRQAEMEAEAEEHRRFIAALRENKPKHDPFGPEFISMLRDIGGLK